MFKEFQEKLDRIETAVNSANENSSLARSYALQAQQVNPGMGIGMVTVVLASFLNFGILMGILTTGCEARDQIKITNEYIQRSRR